ncbi:PHP-associated [uncultured archaeon]|nr:PHP-associated [uncultured archaeon]
MKNTSNEDMHGRADIHVHTRYSGFGNYSFLYFPESVVDPYKAVEAAQRKKLDVLCITDHNTIQGALIAKKYANHLASLEAFSATPKKGIDVVAGEEISSADGEILALFITEKIRPGLGAAETIDCIHEQGGIAIAPHPFSPQCPALQQKIFNLKLDGVEAFNAYHRDAYSNLIAQNFSPKRLARLGSSDAHTLGMIGNGYTTFSGNTGEELRKSIMQGKTSFGGSRTPLSECMSWSREAAREVFRMLHSSLKGEKNNDVLYSKIDRIKKRNKIIGLVGAGVYVGLQLSLFAGVLGEMVLNVKSRRNYCEFKKSYDTSIRLNYSQF